jgi:hypothetical protein
LTDDSFQICYLEKPIEGIYFIGNLKPIHNTNYCLSFGGSNTCGCPIRKELYDRYKL